MFGLVTEMDTVCRYWALAVPVYVMVSIALALMFYIGLNFLSTPSPTSFHIIFGNVIFILVYFIRVGL